MEQIQPFYAWDNKQYNNIPCSEVHITKKGVKTTQAFKQPTVSDLIPRLVLLEAQVEKLTSTVNKLAAELNNKQDQEDR